MNVYLKLDLGRGVNESTSVDIKVYLHLLRKKASGLYEKQESGLQKNISEVHKIFKSQSLNQKGFVLNP